MIKLKDAIVAKKFIENNVINYTVKDLKIKSFKESLTGQVIIKAMVDSSLLAEQDNFFIYPFIYDYTSNEWIRFKMNYVCASLENFDKNSRLDTSEEFTQHFQLCQAAKMYEINSNLVQETL